MIYFQLRNTFQRMYYDFWKKAGRGARLLPIKGNQYLTEYVLLKEFHRHLHPFQFTAPDSNVIQVGCTRILIEMGISQPLIMSSLVGPCGTVLIIEPHVDNTTYLQDFMERYGVKNIAIAKYAVWNKCGTMKLNTFKNTSANTMVDIDDRVGRKRWFRRSGGLQLETPADTIDSIASKHLHGPVGFVNLTINGAELEAIEGMKDLMERYPDMHISIALKHSQDKHYKRRRPLVEVMIERGYNVCIADGQPRPWLEEPFFYAVATRMSEEELGKMGFERATREQVEQVLPAV